MKKKEFNQTATLNLGASGKIAVHMNEALKAKIVETQRKRGISTQAEVLRRGIELYNFICTELDRGHDFMIRNGKGELVKVQFL